MQTRNYLFVLSTCIALLALNETGSVSAGTPAAASLADYDAAQAAQRVNSFKDERPEFRQTEVLERIYKQVVAHQDVDVVIQLTTFDGEAVQGFAFKQIKLLPIPLQKRVVVAVLHNDFFWNYDPVKKMDIFPHGEGQFNLQLYIRRLAGG